MVTTRESQEWINKVLGEYSDVCTEFVFGARGAGKTQGMIEALAKVIIQQEEIEEQQRRIESQQNEVMRVVGKKAAAGGNPPVLIRSEEYESEGDGIGGSYWENPIRRKDVIDSIDSLVRNSNLPRGYITADGRKSEIINTTASSDPKNKFKPEDYKCRFCAVVELACEKLTHTKGTLTGVIFVKKCGYWTFRDYNGQTIAKGKSYNKLRESGEHVVKVIHVIHDAEPTKQIVDEDKEFLELTDND